MIDLIFRQRFSRRDTVPFLKTAAAAASRGMLRDKAGVSAHGSLSAVIGGFGGRQAFQDEAAALMFHGSHSLFCDDPQFRIPESETGTEFRFRQTLLQILPFSFFVHDLFTVTHCNFVSVVI